MATSWPLEMLATTLFEDAGPGKTKVTLRWLPYNAGQAGVSTFDGARAGMEQGFSGMWGKLESYLAKL